MTRDVSSPSGLSIYVHWPYCARICPYCDFNVFKNKVDSALTPALLTDLSAWREWSGPRRVKSLHFGGGTPSLMPAKDIEALIQHVESLWGFEEGAEIALEANPLDASKTVWENLKHVGINRVSVGIQSFQNDALKFLGRDHDADMAKHALSLAGDVFGNFSADLIYGWVGQTEATLSEDLNTALSFAPPHLSAYQLTIEDSTAFGRAARRGIEKAVTSDQSADFYDTVVTALLGSGFEHYEVSNFAKAGFKSSHNLGYWQGRDYAGIGPGAHGRLTVDGTRFATIAALRPGAYAKQVKETGFGIEEKTALTSTEWAEEYFLMGLRISEGIDQTTFKNLGGTLNQKALTQLTQDGFLSNADGRVTATPTGRRLLNALIEQLLT